MISHASSRLVPLALLVGLVCACRTSPRTVEAAPPPAKPDVTAEDIRRAPGQNLEQILRGRVSGVTVWQGSGGLIVRIRGGTPLGDPVYLLDGLPILPGPDGSLTGVDPYDIESIEVLKDLADTALYLRGTNGVVVIKTKQGKAKKKDDT